MDGCLEDVEGCAACPGAPATCFSLGGESHEPRVCGLEDGSLGQVGVCVRTRGNGFAVGDTVETGLDHMLANVAVARAILTRNVCNTVNEVLLLHINRKGVWKRVAVSTEWGVPKCVGVAIEHVGWRVSRLVAVCGSGPLCRSNGRSHNSLGGSSFRNCVNGHTVECLNTLGAQLTVVDCGNLYILCVRYSVGSDLLCGYGIGEVRRERHERQQAQHGGVHDVAVCLRN